MEDLGLQIEVEELWIEDRQSRIEDSIMPHQQLIHMFLFVLWRKSHYFEDMYRVAHIRVTYKKLHVMTHYAHLEQFTTN